MHMSLSASSSILPITRALARSLPSHELSHDPSSTSYHFPFKPHDSNSTAFVRPPPKVHARAPSHSLHNYSPFSFVSSNYISRRLPSFLSASKPSNCSHASAQSHSFPSPNCSLLSVRTTLTCPVSRLNLLLQPQASMISPLLNFIPFSDSLSSFLSSLSMRLLSSKPRPSIFGIRSNSSIWLPSNSKDLIASKHDPLRQILSSDSSSKNSKILFVSSSPDSPLLTLSLGLPR